jgi:hypothetical protein
MTRILLLATVLAAGLSAGTISISSPCPLTTFTVGHLTICNCQTSVTYTDTGRNSFSNLGFGPGTVDQDDFVHIGETGMVTLLSAPVESIIQGTVTADFTMDPQWWIRFVGISFAGGDFGQAVSDGVDLTSPCSTGYSPGFGNPPGCTLSPLLQSGSLSVTLRLHGDAAPLTGDGTVGGGDIRLAQVFITPEPSTVMLIGLGIAVCLISRHSWSRKP